MGDLEFGWRLRSKGVGVGSGGRQSVIWDTLPLEDMTYVFDVVDNSGRAFIRERPGSLSPPYMQSQTLMSL